MSMTGFDIGGPHARTIYVHSNPFSLITNLGTDPDRAKDAIVGVVLTMGQCIQETLVDDGRTDPRLFIQFEEHDHAAAALELLKETAFEDGLEPVARYATEDD
ncbi:hypothetical protein PRIPAC_91363 [Pristionchus pacificus]|uniref:Uncharacterized protein n=1 Tax=Pristionchus pacificus TaxID=54126 RepID=A0A2A6CY73_PRIPA|nr:hypothetical protein PRIPAC_91363 [Pristionchus pacificus]|eukprot:PDM83060.1 hypothetical protein PRIPAC_37453 [Pristionchus pacificus]